MVEAPPDILGSRKSARAQALVWGAVIIFIIAAIIRQPLLALLAVAVVLVVGIVFLWRRYGLRGVSYRRSFSRSRAFPGEEVLLEITVENAKLLPLPWLEVQDDFPDALEYPDLTLEPSPKPKTHIFKTFFSARPYERVRRRYRVVCTRRGYHSFGPVYVNTGDMFGFATRNETVEQIDHLIVYPKVVPVTEFGLPAKQPFGDEKPVRPLLEDPLRFAGVRPYVPGDSPRRVHWRASARTSELQSKHYERSATPTLAIFLDVNTFEHFWQGLDPEALEKAISAAASLAAYGLEERRQVGLFANAPLAAGARSIRILPSRHPAQLGRILDALALLIPYTGNRVENLISSEARRLPWGATLVVVTGYVTTALEETLATLHRNGHAITLLSFGGDVPDMPSRPGFRIYTPALPGGQPSEADGEARTGKEATVAGLADLVEVGLA
ncbi:MAG TPA: DUF58 domain-containing protein [Thermomicrobiaceae bacterium]|nr:DUF58 domain-containing protein [Thermomicrobiaceae bacterium]